MKQESHKNIFQFICSFLILSIITASWAFVYWAQYREIIYFFGYRGSAVYIALYGVLLFVFTSFYGGYRIGYYRNMDVFFSGTLGLLITNILVYIISCLVARNLIYIKPLLILTTVQILLIWAWSMIASGLYHKLFPAHKMLLVYGGKEFARSLIQKMISRSEKYSIQASIDMEEGFDAVCAAAKTYQSIILCDLPSMYRNRLLKFCFKESIRTYTTPKISDILIRGATEISLFDTPLLLNKNSGLSFEQAFFKRFIDIFISTVGILISWPFMLLTALAIKIYDGGPVVFRQKRCTLNNRVFTLIKFRSMIVDAEKDGKSQPATDSDPRITPVGRFIRATRLDELPQLWNILRGDMSIVGPRPERIEHVEKYTEEIPEFIFRSKVKAGLTGYAQVVGRYNTSAYDKLKMDLMYISNYSLVEDFKLMLITIKILFKKTSTQGFENSTSKRNSNDINKGE